MAAFELGAPQFATAQKTVDNDPIVTLVAARPQRREVVIYNHASGADVYIGGSAVTSSTGLLLTQGSSVTLATTAAVYGVTASGEATLSLMELYQ